MAYAKLEFARVPSPNKQTNKYLFLSINLPISFPPPPSFQIENRAMDYSIDDRVEVLWEQKLYTAEVRAVYTNGKVDVVYDADASAGYLLSEAEHGLNKMWMPNKKGKGAGGGNAKVCSVDGCSNSISARGLCAHHGRKPCSIEGCTTKAHARGLCVKHGANGKCVQMGCVTNALKRGGHCSKHSKKDACASPNC